MRDINTLGGEQLLSQKSTVNHSSRLWRFLSKEKHRISPLLILTHDYPDPDALASAYALRFLVRRVFGIRSRIAYGGIIGRKENREMVRILHLPVHRLRVSDLARYQHFALVDTQPDFRNNSFPRDKKATIVIDQHAATRGPSAELSIVESEYGATSTLLAQTLLARGMQIPSKVATALIYGILSDTLHLYRVGRTEDVEAYLSLLPLCDMRALARIENPSRSRRFFATLVKGITGANVCRHLIVSHLGPVENPDLVSQIADVLLTTEGMNVSFCTCRYGPHLHVSLRMAHHQSRAGKILQDVVTDHGQAGGHGQIAGGKVIVGNRASEHQWTTVERSLAARLKNRLRIPRASRFRRAFERDRHI
ncbi:MAG: DHH family phosphoesterase [Bacteroidota bacterium]